MAVTAHAPILPGRDLWHGRFGSALVLMAVALPFAAALVWAATLPRIDDASVSASIRTTASLVDHHAAAMIRVGERIVGAAAASSAADRSVWASYGQHMIADGRGLQDLGGRLRGTAVVAQADLIHRGNVDVAAAALEARWEQLRADGRATAEHGRVMVGMAADLSAGVREGMLTNTDVQEIRQASAGMAEAGDQVARCADSLLSSTAQMRRWMGIGR